MFICCSQAVASSSESRSKEGYLPDVSDGQSNNKCQHRLQEAVCMAGQQFKSSHTHHQRRNTSDQLLTSLGLLSIEPARHVQGRQASKQIAI